MRALQYEQWPIGRARAGRPSSIIHSYRFDVDGRTVELRHGSAVPLNDGDDVVVVCAGARDPIRVYAYANRTWGASLIEPAGFAAAMRGWLPALPAAGLLAAIPALGPESSGWAVALATMVVLLATGFALIALRGFVEYARYRRAARSLERAL